MSIEKFNKVINDINDIVASGGLDKSVNTAVVSAGVGGIFGWFVASLAGAFAFALCGAALGGAFSAISIHNKVNCALQQYSKILL